MNADIVNLRLVRKRKARADEAQRAAQNRSMHGRTKAEKAKSRLEAEADAKRLEAHKREPSTPRS